MSVRGDSVGERVVGETVLERGLWRWSKAAARVKLVLHIFHLKFLKVYKLRIV